MATVACIRTHSTANNVATNNVATNNVATDTVATDTVRTVGPELR